VTHTTFGLVGPDSRLDPAKAHFMNRTNFLRGNHDSFSSLQMDCKICGTEAFGATFVRTVA
jgi:hypothetical protein